MISSTKASFRRRFEKLPPTVREAAVIPLASSCHQKRKRREEGFKLKLKSRFKWERLPPHVAGVRFR
jgi:hypothetical protein